ncbi:MAG: Uma2 family endonuclease [Candidatus Poribacteria bacterium]|nr:Uma2 family endonuclease [Candidatus Poribacteria bacterium]
METRPNTLLTPYAPTEASDLYPESDGKPMAETDLHIDAIIRVRHILRAYFAGVPDVYISGNLMMYYEDSRPPKAVSPDILVTFGVGKKPRRTYKIWEEGKPPDLVIEFSSKGTVQTDLVRKKELYAELGIPEYFLCDVDRRYLPTPLIGFRLVGGEYIEISPNADGGIRSEILGLDFCFLADGLGIYNPTTEEWLQTPEEAANARAARDRKRAERAETELARLQEELARLKEGT